MNTTPFDNLVRTITTGISRRSAVSALALGAIAAVPGNGSLPDSGASARKKKRKKRKKKQKDQAPRVIENVCAGKNWCVDRNQVCGPAGGYGKCFVEATGGNLCAEILFQAANCSDCAAPA